MKFKDLHLIMTPLNAWSSNAPMRNKWNSVTGIDIIPTQIFGGGWDFII